MNSKEREHAAEQWLNETIEHLQRARPRAGLEARIIANLQIRARQQQRRWIFALTGAAAALAVVFSIAFSRVRQEGAPTVTHESNLVRAGSTPSLPVTSNLRPEKVVRQDSRAHHKLFLNHVTNRAVEVPAATVHQETFPSLAPLTEQGRLFQKYLRTTPRRELALIAARQSSSAEINDLSIASIEIQDLSPMENRQKTGEQD